MGPVDLALDCRLCGGQRVPHTVLGKVPVTHAGPLAQRDYRLARCSACEVIYLDPLPTAQDIAILYAGSAQFTDAQYSGGREATRIVSGYARRLEYLGLLPAAGDAILEVGAGFAWICKASKQHDPGVRTVAQDVSGECAAKCPWVDEYFVGPVESVPRAAFRLVSMTHVIEHLPRPARMLAQLSERVVPGGHVYITAPFRPPLWQPKHGLRPWLAYSYLHVPAHISYLSKRWLRDAAAKCGFELVHWDDSHDGHQVFEAVLRKR